MAKYVIKRTIDPKAGADAFVRPRRNEGIALPLDEALEKLGVLNIDIDAEGVQYDNENSGMAADNVQEAIDELDSRLDTLESNIGTGQASDISYDNSTSGLSATNVQDAIDEIVTGRLKFKTFNLTIPANSFTEDTETGKYFYEFDNPSTRPEVVSVYMDDGSGNFEYTDMEIEFIYNNTSLIYDKIRLWADVNPDVNLVVTIRYVESETANNFVDIQVSDWVLSDDSSYYYYDIANEDGQIKMVRCYELDSDNNFNRVELGVKFLYDAANANFSTCRLIIKVDDTANPSASLPSGIIRCVMGA